MSVAIGHTPIHFIKIISYSQFDEIDYYGFYFDSFFKLKTDTTIGLMNIHKDV